MAQQTVLTRTTQQTNEKQGSLGYFLEIASFFLDPQNQDKTFDNFWTFEKIDALLRSWAIPFDPKMRDASLKDILNFLEKIDKQQLTEITVPTPLLEGLIAKAEQTKKQAEESKQAARDLVEKLTRSPVDPQKRPKLSRDLSSNISESLQDSELPILIKKVGNLPPETEEYKQLQEKILGTFSAVWQEAVEKAGMENYLSDGEIKRLKEFSFPALQTVNPAEYLQEIGRQRQQTIEVIKKIVFPFPLSEEQKNQTAENVTDALISSQSFKKPLSLLSTPPKTQEEQVGTQIKETVASILKTLGVPEAEERLGKQVISKQGIGDIPLFLERIRETNQRQEEKINQLLSPPLDLKKAEAFVNEFSQPFFDHLAQYSSPIPSVKEIEEAAVSAVWQMIGAKIQLKPEEAEGVIASVVNLSQQDIISYKKLSSSTSSVINPLQLKEESGKTVFEKIKQQLFSNGININPETDKLLKTLRFQIQAIETIYKGISKQDLETKINNLLKAGFIEHSREIIELKGVTAAYEEILQRAREAGFPKKQVDEWQKQGLFSIKVTKGRLNLDFINSLGRKGVPNIQALYTLITSLKKQKVSFFPKVLNFLLNIGKQSGFTFVNVVQKVIPPRLIRNMGEGLAGVLSGQNRTVNSFTNATRNLLSGIANPSFSNKNVGKFVNFGIIGFVAVIFMVVIAIGGAFSSQAGSVPRETTGCFSFEGSWNNQDLEFESSAIAKIMSLGKYSNSLCQSGSLIKLVRESGNDWCYVYNGEIHLPDKCIGSEENALYSLAHESGHIYAARNGIIYTEFIQEFGSADRMEGAVCTYPFKPIRASEDFAESIAVYVTNQYYSDHIYPYCGSKEVILQTNYPLHYNFVTNYIF